MDTLCRVCGTADLLKPLEQMQQNILSWMFKQLDTVFQSYILQICSTCCLSVNKYKKAYSRKREPKYRVALVVWDSIKRSPVYHENGKPYRYSIAANRRLDGTSRGAHEQLDENELRYPPESTNIEDIISTDQGRPFNQSGITLVSTSNEGDLPSDINLSEEMEPEVSSSSSSISTMDLADDPMDERLFEKMVTAKITGAVRKSIRKQQSDIRNEEDTIENELILKEDNIEDLEIKAAGIKGEGVFTKRIFKHKEFICTYKGTFLTETEAIEVEKQNPTNGVSYMYYFEHEEKKYCIDATENNSNVGRKINHSQKKPNLRVYKKFVAGEIHLYFRAIKILQVGDELLYDYGDRNYLDYPWLKD